MVVRFWPRDALVAALRSYRPVCFRPSRPNTLGRWEPLLGEQAWTLGYYWFVIDGLLILGGLGLGLVLLGSLGRGVEGAGG